MNRRERLENKMERRLDWAQTRDEKANAAWQTADQLGNQIPLGQPIPIGYPEENRVRRGYERISRNYARSFENSDMAEYHREKAAGLSKYLDKAIFEDDGNAVEALEERIASLEAIQQHMASVNIICKNKKLTIEQKVEKLKTDFPELSEEAIHELLNPNPQLGKHDPGYRPYQLTNNGANIRRYKKRLESVKLRQKKAVQAEESENGLIIEDRPCGYVQITFAEKPDRSILNDLNAADFRWGKGSWFGKKESLPESVKNYQI